MSIMSIEPGMMVGPVQLGAVRHKQGACTVYDGHHVRLGSDVSMRVLHGCPVEDRVRFLRDARMTTTLQHPALLRVLDFGEYDDARYLVTLRERGRTLEQYLAENKAPPSERAIMRMLVGVADLLRVCHSIGVVHRDLQPASLLINERGQLLVTQLGFAPASGMPSQERDGSFAERSRYLAPEYRREEGTIDGPADLFSLGVIAYELMFQRLPYPSWTDEELVSGATLEPPRFDLPTHCSPRQVLVVGGLIDPDPTARITSASDLLQQLPASPRPTPAQAAERPADALRQPGDGVSLQVPTGAQRSVAGAKIAAVSPAEARSEDGSRMETESNAEPASPTRAQDLLLLQRLFGAAVSMERDGEVVHSTLTERLIVWGLLLSLVAATIGGLIASVA